MNEEKMLRKVLRENQLKVTTPRLHVFHLLHGQEPKSMPELIELSRGKVDRVTTYRVIDLFEKLGIVRRVTLGWQSKVELSEIFLDHHHHITCLNCKKVTAIEEDEIVEQILSNLGEQSGFTVSSHQLELQGYCPKCQKISQLT